MQGILIIAFLLRGQPHEVDHMRALPYRHQSERDVTSLNLRFGDLPFKSSAIIHT
jgi:hypothetical protein